jgi:hypothetical protein
MNPNTGEIYENVTPTEARARGLVPIARRDEKRVLAMTPGDRVAWAASKRTAKDKRKAQRQARKKGRG